MTGDNVIVKTRLAPEDASGIGFHGLLPICLNRDLQSFQGTAPCPAMRGLSGKHPHRLWACRRAPLQATLALIILHRIRHAKHESRRKNFLVPALISRDSLITGTHLPAGSEAVQEHAWRLDGRWARP